MINYHEFLAALFPVEKYATRERLESLFEKFKGTNHDYISKRDLREAFSKLGHNITSEEIYQVMGEHDLDGDNHIMFDEFKKMIL